jgi:hypothetical protein
MAIFLRISFDIWPLGALLKHGSQPTFSGSPPLLSERGVFECFKLQLFQASNKGCARLFAREISVMNNKLQTFSYAGAVALSALSTSYAHAGPLYSCVFENSQNKTRLELRVRDDSNDGVFSYSYSPDSSQAPVQGKFDVRKTGATWSHFIFTGSDTETSVKLSVPAGLNEGSVYAEIETKVGEITYEPRIWLACTRAR